MRWIPIVILLASCAAPEPAVTLDVGTVRLTISDDRMVLLGGNVRVDETFRAALLARPPARDDDPHARAEALLADWLAQAPEGYLLGDHVYPIRDESADTEHGSRVVDEGLTILSQCCGGGEALEAHDACDHPAQTSSAVCGTKPRCDGACGQFCDTTQIYTKDCLDHDMCTHHQVGHCDLTHQWYELTNHIDCKNEYADATDDFLKINIAPIFLPPLYAWVAQNACPDPPPAELVTPVEPGVYPSVFKKPRRSCVDHRDNDGDRLVDEADECACEKTALACNDGIDNDCDGAIDEQPDECRCAAGTRWCGGACLAKCPRDGVRSE